MKNPALTAAEIAIKRALNDNLMGLPEPVAADATISKAAKDAIEAVLPFFLAEGVSLAAREITGNDERSRIIRKHLGDRAESMRRRAITSTRERSAA